MKKNKNIFLTALEKLFFFHQKFARIVMPIFTALLLLVLVISYIWNMNTGSFMLSESALAILITMSGLCFSYVRSIPSDSQNKTGIIRAGELFFSATIFMIISATLRYLILQIIDLRPEIVFKILGFTGTYLAIIFFILSCVFTWVGLRTIQRILIEEIRPDEI